MMSEDITSITSMKVKDGRGYTPQVRSFALSLHFYSPKAYKYVREKFNKHLPSVSTIKSWYRVVDGSPGFTDESFKAIELRCKEKSGIVNLVLDEMSIKEEIIYDKKEFHGGINFGTILNTDSAYSDNDNPITAKNALVLMAVSLNENWKIPIGYFLVRSLNAEERASILRLAFELLQKANCKVYSITFDGAASNISMCNSLGANLNFGPNFKPYFTNPATSEKCYIFYDFCHMIKLIRNTLGDHKIIKTVDNKSISWSYIEKLHDLQCKEGLRVANKLTKKHVHYQNNKMNVKLAIQTLSESVSKALNFLQMIDDTEIQKDFQDSSETALFCLNFNNMGDMLNCKNKFSKGEFNTPLTDDTYSKMKEHALKFENYIITLCNDKGTPLINSQRKTGFIGMIIALRNIFPLYDKLKQEGMSYLLTYKLSQDYIETFFSAIRSRGGFNNNPNVLQFKSAYKRLLVKHELKQFENGNCAFDNVDILHVSSNTKNCHDQIGHADLLRATENPDISDHDYIRYCWELTPFVENIVLYIAGYVSHRVSKIIFCSVCQNQLISDESRETMPLLSLIKNRGPFKIPSKDVISICKISEKIIRQYSHELLNKNIKTTVTNQICQKIGIMFDNKEMNEHVLLQNFSDNHRHQLCKWIIEVYLNTRFFYEAKKLSVKDNYVRQKYNKLILFYNQ